MTCQWCEEEILATERCGCVVNGDLHHECATRMVCGSVGHLIGLCHCVGGSLEDPPNMTKRQAAIAAMQIVMSRQRAAMPGPVAAAFVIRFFPGSASIELLTKWPSLDQLPRPIPTSITCPKCQRVSHNPNDVRERYCGACHEYHADMNLRPREEVLP